MITFGGYILYVYTWQNGDRGFVITEEPLDQAKLKAFRLKPFGKHTYLTSAEREEAAVSAVFLNEGTPKTFSGLEKITD